MKRRVLLEIALLGVSGVGTVSNAQEMTPLTESDPLARGLDYHSDAKTVDVREYPEYEATQSCSACLHFQAGTGPVHGCKLAPGRSISPGGWCKLWTARSP